LWRPRGDLTGSWQKLAFVAAEQRHAAAPRMASRASAGLIFKVLFRTLEDLTGGRPWHAQGFGELLQGAAIV
jgi:hypothetical protein